MQYKINLWLKQKNKKDKLESYYQLYEENFTDEELVKESFDVVLGEILKILPEISQTRWKKKTDFYSLFLVFANHKAELPLSKDKREEAKNILLDFGMKVSKRQQLTTNEEDFTADSAVDEYAKGMRATTDLSSRKYRQNAIERVLTNIWN